ncbi:MAG TPA: rod shape-determining protein MreD [Nitrospinae bacterium]|jgi:rod shape-determining protein MreD|nr:rod shape-determining protein MreD [Nitrospinota bacterium]
MYYFAQILIVIILFAIQTTWLGMCSIGGVVPDLALIWVVYCGVHCSRAMGIGSGIVIGILQDSLSGGLLGVNTLSKSFIGFFFATLKDKFYVEGVIPVAFFLVASSLFDGLVFYFSMNTVLKGEVASSFIYQSLPVYSIYNGIVGPILFLLFNQLNNWLRAKTSDPYMNPVK